MVEVVRLLVPSLQSPAELRWRPWLELVVVRRPVGRRSAGREDAALVTTCSLTTAESPTTLDARSDSQPPSAAHTHGTDARQFYHILHLHRPCNLIHNFMTPKNIKVQDMSKLADPTKRFRSSAFCCCGAVDLEFTA